MSMLPVGFGGSVAAYDIAKSVRFRSSASAYLSDTLSTPTDNNVWTWSAWVKRGALGVGPHVLWGADPSTGGSNIFYIRFDNDALNILQDTGGATSLNATTTAVFRDPSAWYHIQVVFNTDEATSTNRLKVYVNSVLQSLTYAVGPLASGAVSQANTAKVHNFGRLVYANVQYFDGYLSEINFVDGQALDPSSFGQFDANGVWQPKKYTGTYGTNGFYLPFNDGTTLTNLCLDRSGNANNWTASGVSLTAGVNYDWMDDTPTNNFATLNPLHAGRSTLSNTNLSASGTTDLPTIVPSSGTWYFERGGVAQTWTPPAAFPAGSGDYNFGQRPFSGSPTNPTLCTKNLPAASIENPRLHFDIALATGASIKATAEAVFPSNYLEWIKDRGNANNHQLIDTVRGSSAVLQSNTTAAETTYTAPSGSSVGWVWKAGGAAVTNTSGSITSQVSANTTAGFSVATYTGTGANATVGHGLGVAPKMVIVKTRSVGTYDWCVYHANLTSAGHYVPLSNTSGQTASSNVWNSTAPTTSVFSVGTSVATNQSAATLVAYCFAEVPGFSRIGSYTGNGSADGPFVYCGFRPRWVLIKRTDSTENWQTVDAARDASNVSINTLYPNLSNAESTGVQFDFTANGFKVKSTTGGGNTSGGTYIFMAFAETPFQSSRAR